MDANEKEFAIELAKKAGSIIKKNFKLEIEKKLKADNTIVTQTDLDINNLVLNSIRKKFPEHDILSEEESDLSKKSEYVWVCDPLDGTIAFAHGIPTCVFSLSLVKNGEPILGVVYDPFEDRLFYAEKGKGAFLNGEKINVSNNNQFERSMIGLIYWKGAQFDFIKLFENLIDKGAYVLDVGSLVYIGALVANGGFSAVIHPADFSHDSAALKIIVEEAGGKVTDIFGNEQAYDKKIKGCLISNSIMHEELLKLIKESVK